MKPIEINSQALRGTRWQRGQRYQDRVLWEGTQQPQHKAVPAAIPGHEGWGHTAALIGNALFQSWSSNQQQHFTAAAGEAIALFYWVQNMMLFPKLSPPPYEMKCEILCKSVVALCFPEAKRSIIYSDVIVNSTARSARLPCLITLSLFQQKMIGKDNKFYQVQALP